MPVPDPRPNILLIVADDMGYSDLGSYGGEIETPSLDALAARGLRATDFTVTPGCSPTRAILLTGADNHLAGFGNAVGFMGPRQRGKPGYEGHLNDRVTTVASRLRDAGYHTYMAGKWHLGGRPAQWPAARGLERDFALLDGSGSHFSDMSHPDHERPIRFTLNGRRLDELPVNHFSSAAYTDFIIRSIEEQRGDGRPFLALLSFQAVHRPLAAPDDWLERYRGWYAMGYDSLRAQRLARMKEMGVVGKDVIASPRLPGLPAWEDLTQQEKNLAARKMEVYAAMLANMDFHIGRVIEYLEMVDELDDTLVIFLSDNGAEFVEFADRRENPSSSDVPKSWGRKGSAVAYGPAWAQVGSTPFRMFKGYLTEGGIRSPLIVAGPGVAREGEVSDATLHVSDIVPTLLDVAGVPSKEPSRNLAPLEGKSLVPLLVAGTEEVRTNQEWIAWELFGNRAVRQGKWKALSLVAGAGGSGEWQLFDLREDPAEMRDLSGENPGKRDELAALWDEYARTNGVILTGDGPFARAPFSELRAGR